MTAVIYIIYMLYPWLLGLLDRGNDGLPAPVHSAFEAVWVGIPTKGK